MTWRLYPAAAIVITVVGGAMVASAQTQAQRRATASASHMDLSPEALMNARVQKLESRMQVLQAENASVKQQLKDLQQRLDRDEVDLHHKLGVPGGCSQVGWAKGDAMGISGPFAEHLFFSVRNCRG
jgi:hypothetical protein